MRSLIKLVIPPFVPVNQPSLGVSSLVAVLKNSGFAAEACYLNLDYLELIGEELYNHLGNSFRGSFLSGEYLFTPALWLDHQLTWEEYEKSFSRYKLEKLQRMCKEEMREHDTHLSRELEKLFQQTEDMVTHWAESLLDGEPRIIGFSTTFQQTIPSLALARRVKQLSGGKIVTLMGGANCRGDMGQAILDNFPWVDYVVSGEAETIITELVADIVQSKAPKLKHRQVIQAPPVIKMDQLPTPDFHDYFSHCKRLKVSFSTNLVGESSRGCWWGEKSHCTFCGLNGEYLNYRHKSPEKIVSEIISLREVYQKEFFMMTDNILHREVASALRKNFQGSTLRFFYEVKANLSKKQIIELAQAGILWIQPGIENLSTPLLKRINKGTSQLQNIQILKYCTELGLGVSWNILYNLPGETKEDYQTNSRIIPKLYHLIPPHAIPMRLERFSSYWHNPERYALGSVHHLWPYDFLFHPLPLEQRSRLATYFDYSPPEDDGLVDHRKTLILAVLKWRQKFCSTTCLQLQETINGCFILDSRFGEKELTLISILEQELLQRLDEIISFDRLFESVQKDGMGGETVNKNQLFSLLQIFVERGWVLREENIYFSIVIDPSLKYRVYSQKGNSP